MDVIVLSSSYKHYHNSRFINASFINVRGNEPSMDCKQNERDCSSIASGKQYNISEKYNPLIGNIEKTYEMKRKMKQSTDYRGIKASTKFLLSLLQNAIFYWTMLLICSDLCVTFQALSDQSVYRYSE